MARRVPLEKELGDRKPGVWKGNSTYTDKAVVPLTELDDLGFE